ncbi:MAG: hypothetical protein HYR75_09055 [Gemmatimonadetes bacterium]|nr:hypothetical protein [Gemmatimonadota bacterium]MBI3567271.1 hypothetical protein [Gemmatimonadota bacterium]
MIRRISLLLAVVLATGIAACGESLTTSNTCPALCPAQDVAVHDTVISPVLAFDSTFVGFPDRGNELGLLLATRGDTVETRGVVRFDSLLFSYPVPSDTARPITTVDSTRVKIVLDRTRATLPSSVRFEVYDVDDSTADDTTTTAVLAKFVPSRRLGSLTVLKDSLTDTLLVPISDSAMLAKIKAKSRLRLGFRVDGTGSASVIMKTTETGWTTTVTFRPARDSTILPITISAFSGTPKAQPDLQTTLTDYQVIAKYNMPPAPPNTMSVGGVPGRRTYLRFNLPRYITDSTTVVRATLRLTQVPVAFGGVNDSITVKTHPVLAGPLVTDLRRAATILGSSGIGVYDSLLVVPTDTGVKNVEMYGLVRLWGAQVSLLAPPTRSVVLRASEESLYPTEVRFYGTNAPPALRPSMRITYIPKVTFGVP